MVVVGTVWGIIGIFSFIGYAVYRLSLISLDALQYPFAWYHWLALFANILFMAYAEGYRGFQKKFSPRVAARLQYLAESPRITLVVLAPLFCMGFFYASKRTMIAIYSLTIGIFLATLAIRLLPQPWRGIVDAGVVVGLSWGLISLGIFCAKALASKNFSYDADVQNVPATLALSQNAEILTIERQV